MRIEKRNWILEYHCSGAPWCVDWCCESNDAVLEIGISDECYVVVGVGCAEIWKLKFNISGDDDDGGGVQEEQE